jgi:hypothetical protein
MLSSSKTVVPIADDVVDTTYRRPRPPLLVAALIVATSGLYAAYWLYATWRELKRELKDPSMSPIGHVLAFLVPFYSYYRLHAHLRTIRDLSDRAGASTSLSTGLCMLVWLAASAVDAIQLQVAMRGGSSLPIVSLATTVAFAMVVAWAQAGLNTAWATLPKGAPPFRVHPVEVILLCLGPVVLFFGLI